MIQKFNSGVFTKGQGSQLSLLSKVATYLLLAYCSWGITTGYDTCRNTRSVSEHALTGHVIYTHDGKRVETCITNCERTEKCFSINYYSRSKRCDLNDKTAEWHPSDLMPTQGALYLPIVSRDYTPCIDQNPPCFGVCLPILGSLETRCVCEGNATCYKDSCSKPLGMEDGLITDKMINASSTHSSSKRIWGRLHSSEGSWTPNDDYKHQWFQVNFGPEVKRITRIATQGDGKNHYWVKKYYVMYKKKGASSLEKYMASNKVVNFSANTNQNAVVTNKIANPFEATAVRIIPTEFQGRIALRIELYGCDIK